MTEIASNFENWLLTYLPNLLFTLLSIAVFFLINRILLPAIDKYVQRSKFKSNARMKAYHTIRLITGIMALAAIFIIWGVDFSGLLLISTSLITITGVALFASWSLLSSVTSYFLLLTNHSFVRGNFIRIIDGDNYIEGFISDVTLFNVKLITEEREVVMYPNNLIITRPSMINPKRKWQTIGKSTDSRATPVSQNTNKQE